MGTLLGSQGPECRNLLLLGLIIALILLLILELGVACIQAYVFTILRSLYLNELSYIVVDLMDIIWNEKDLQIKRGYNDDESSDDAYSHNLKLLGFCRKKKKYD